METYIRFNESNYQITYIHHRPFDPVQGLNSTREELLETGVFVTDFLEPVSVTGKRAVAYYNPETKKVYYKYEAAPLSTEERFDLLEAAVNYALMKEAE